MSNGGFGGVTEDESCGHEHKPPGDHIEAGACIAAEFGEFTADFWAVREGRGCRDGDEDEGGSIEVGGGVSREIEGGGSFGDEA